MPASVTKIVAKPTRKTLRADQRMRAAIISAASCCVKALSAALQIALGIDQECCRGDDFLALAEPVEHLDIAVAATAELDRPRLEAAFALGDQHDLPRAAVDHRAGRNGDRRAFVRARCGTRHRRTCRSSAARPGFGSSMRTRAVLVSALSSGIDERHLALRPAASDRRAR